MPGWLSRERCLVDADYLATERFVCPDRSADREQVQPGIQAMRTALEAHLAALMRKAAATAGESNEVNRQRRAVLEACQGAAAQEPGLFSLPPLQRTVRSPSA